MTRERAAPADGAIELPADLELNDEFRAAFELMEGTRKSLFITGKAGTGKSTLLQYFRLNTRKNIVVLAPTGVAAIKVRGQTIHSFFNFPPRLIRDEHCRRLRKEKLVQRLDALVIDEASMLRADLLDGIDRALRINRDSFDEPFGGVQIILFGDLFQLPPVVDRDMGAVMGELYASPYFFSARVIREMRLGRLELTKIYRQKDDAFIALLNKVRTKECAAADLAALNLRFEPAARPVPDGVITLTATNQQ
ncbi:MAG: AAA family ATPase, partial [Candidatus Omnitrophota bacterium]